MELEQLIITKQHWGPMEGKYTGSVTFKGQVSRIEIQLGTELSREVLKICAEQLVEQARETGKLLTGEIIQQIDGRIEDKSGT